MVILLCKPEDLSSDPQVSTQNPGVTVSIGNPSAVGRAERAGSLKLLASLSQLVKSRLSEKLSFKESGIEQPRELSQVLL